MGVLNKFYDILIYLQNLNLKVSIHINETKINRILTIILFLLGIKSIYDYIQRHILKVIWQALKDGWQGALHLKTS